MTDEPTDDPRAAALPELAEIQKHIPDATMPAAVGVGAIALGMALRFHDTTIIKDGTMYQQYKMEGKNIRALELDMVFETAIRIERHLISTSQRIGTFMEDVVGEAIARELGEGLLEQAADEPPTTGGSDAA